MTHRPYKAYSLKNYHTMPQYKYLSAEQIEAIEVVGRVLPFKANSYVVDELIQWDNLSNDPIFKLVFPQKGMLSSHHYEIVQSMLKDTPSSVLKDTIAQIRLELNPHPAGQLEHNVPILNGKRLFGVQHKYDQTALIFPAQGQTCHAYCTFCFRWPQFVGDSDYRQAIKHSDLVVEYLRQNPQITDVLFTGGDPLVMPTKILNSYLEAILNADLPHIKNIRIGTKTLGYWPYRFISDPDAQELLALFKTIAQSDRQLAIMAHFNHPAELKTPAVQEAIRAIRATGANIRSQSPLLRHINDSAEVWGEMWQLQVSMGIIPYYMFIARDTGAQNYFAVSLARAWKIYRQAIQQVSGLGRTVRGPSMSANEGKVQIVGVSEIAGQEVFVLQFLQGRNSEWVHRPFFAQYDPNAVWLDDLEPLEGESEFFFQHNYNVNRAY